MTGVWGASETDAWAVSPNHALHFDGASWSPIELPEQELFVRFPLSVWGSGAGDVFIAANNGVWHCHGP